MEAAAAYDLDPRWREKQPLQPSSGLNSGAASPSQGSFSGRQSSFRRPPTHQDSFRNDTNSLSIVFNAQWVRLITPIGEGAFSRVFEGVYTNPDNGDATVVAVKILKKNMLKRRSDCLRFIKEAKIMTKINHRNIVSCYGIGKYDDEDEQNPGSLFIVQELIKGGNLLHKVYKQMLNRHKCVYTSAEALVWLLDVAVGMQYLHQVVPDISKPMIIHRDLKLENIMLMPGDGPNGIVTKLVDFGLHKVIDDRIKKVVKRVMSEACMGGGFGGLMNRSCMHQNAAAELDEDDELEVALAEQRAKAEAAEAAAAALAGQPGSPTSRFAPLRRAAGDAGSAGAMPALSEEGAEEEEEQAAGAGQPDNAAPPARTPSFKSPLGRAVEAEASGGESPTGPVPARVRSLPKKQNSMQKLVAKMKEVKMRLTGKDKVAELGEPHGADKPADKPAEKAAAAVQAPLTPEQQERQTKMAQNEALLNKLIQQQATTMAADEKHQIMDDLGIMAGPAGGDKRRAPPRRAVTWVNEIRYNLTGAVGSWAYMAPEVVLGHPYNEKVDVFSFGVILFEVLNRKLMLVDEIKNDPRKDAQAYAERVARGFRPEIPRRWPEPLRDVISACWAQDPHMRPNFTAVVDIMEELQESGVIPQLDVLYWSGAGGY